MIRLVSVDAVKEIICKHENRLIQRTMIYEIEKLNGCEATEEQMTQILDDEDIQFEDDEPDSRLGPENQKYEVRHCCECKNFIFKNTGQRGAVYGVCKIKRYRENCYGRNKACKRFDEIKI